MRRQVYRQGTYTAEGIKAIAAGIRDSGFLTAVDTRRNGIRVEGAEQLAAAVLRSSSMVTFGDVPIKELRADAVTTLNLHNKNLGPTEALVLVGLLPMSRSLTQARPYHPLESAALLRPYSYYSVFSWQIYLSFNQVGKEGAEALAPAIRYSCSLTMADLRYNNLDTEAATMLAIIAKDKKISLCGIAPDQTEANFRPLKNNRNYMKHADAILLTADLAVRGPAVTNRWRHCFRAFRTEIIPIQIHLQVGRRRLRNMCIYIDASALRKKMREKQGRIRSDGGKTFDRDRLTQIASAIAAGPSGV